MTAGRAGDTVFITHDFFMRVLELYIRRSGTLGKVHSEDLQNTQRNLYLQGFATENPPNAFIPISG